MTTNRMGTVLCAREREREQREAHVECNLRVGSAFIPGEARAAGG